MCRYGSKGFTLVETLFVSFLIVLIIQVMLLLWTNTQSITTKLSRIETMRGDMALALETMRDELRLSTRDTQNFMRFYPEDGISYHAVSFPVGSRNIDNGRFLTDAAGQIIPQATIVYHLFDDNGEQSVRKTVVEGRVLSQAELNDLVEQGDRGSCPDSTTQEDFLRDVAAFEISTGFDTIDFYTDSATPVRSQKVVLGYAMIQPGNNSIKLEVVGKNEHSNGYGLGIERIMIEPAGSPRDMVLYSTEPDTNLGSLTAYRGEPITIRDLEGSDWPEKGYIKFLPYSSGSYEDPPSLTITDHYDLWRESSFHNVTLYNTAVRSGSSNHVEVTLPHFAHSDEEDPGERAGAHAWSAIFQTGDMDTSGEQHHYGRDAPLSDDLPEAGGTVCIRNVLYIEQLQEEDPDLIRVAFAAPSQASLSIKAAYITRRAGDEDTGPQGMTNTDPSGKTPEGYHNHQQLFFKDGAGVIRDSVTVEQNETIWSEWTAFPLRAGREYFITLAVENGTARKYQNTLSENVIFSHFQSGDEQQMKREAGKPHSPRWEASYENEHYGPNIWIVSHIETAQARGAITSQVFDTALQTPAYGQIRWSELVPGSSEISLKVRAHDHPDMRGARAWDSGTTIAGNNSPLSLNTLSGRYAQFKAQLDSDIHWRAASGSTLSYEAYIRSQLQQGQPYSFPRHGTSYYATAAESPQLSHVTVDWTPAAARYCRITGHIVLHKDHGIARLRVNDAVIMDALDIRVELNKDHGEKGLTMSGRIKVEPRNTGRFLVH